MNPAKKTAPLTLPPLNTPDLGAKRAASWVVPAFEAHEFRPKSTTYCFIVVIWNEGERIKDQLRRMKCNAGLADIIIADGDSSDGSTAHDFLQRQGVRTLLVTREKGLSTATRMAVAYALREGYEGMVTVDGNGKDGIEALPDFIGELRKGYDLIQGSRFMKGGYHKNTPLHRHIGIRFLFSPILSVASGFHYTDPTNAFRAISRRFLLDPRVQPFRREFVRFSLQFYFDYRAARLGYNVKEIPVRRVYPADGPMPTKIHGAANFISVLEMILVAFGCYNHPDENFPVAKKSPESGF